MADLPPRQRVHRCFECGMPDPYNGHGDGIGSCMCPRCDQCGWAPGVCNCSDDYFFDEYCAEMESGRG